MGILDLMLGETGPGEQGVEGNSYTLPKDTHAFVYPVAVRRTEIDAFAELLEAEADAPYLEEHTDELQEVFDEALGGVDVDASELVERKRQARLAAEPLIDHWRDHLTGEIDTVYARPGTDSTLRSFVKLCKQRDEQADDPFELPESFEAVPPLLKRVEEATDDQYRAVVHTDLLPAES
ncbi:hypothetical protein [Halopiger djelfimassiliensis]|uniref:hypothetical protein n=1 Tax=Halopiger djelfimassiliensis TaxID=1293047 RepID=UPI000677B4B1|nr:hypothetical protein [Halopiger djelfimassiliensis]